MLHIFKTFLPKIVPFVR